MSMKPHHRNTCEYTKNLVDGKCKCYDSFDQFLQEEFMSGGFADRVTKDNFEDAFANWLSDIDPEFLIQYADSYGDYRAALAATRV